MSSTRSSTNPPEYYNRLNSKQQKNWIKNTRKMEKNDSLREKYPAFHPSSNIEIIHIHHQSTRTSIDQLIIKAKQTKYFVVDTECQKGETINQGALIQIQFIHSITYSTLILIEINFLPQQQSILFTKIKELCSMIFNNNNGIISWGSIDKEFEHFQHLNLVHIGKIINYDLQSLFSNPTIEPKTHPAMERRVEITGSSFLYDTPGDNDYILVDDDYDALDYDYYDEQIKSNSNQPMSLQDAIATTFNKFLDKSITVNYWKCGLDVKLNTWKNKLFSHKRYDQNIEQQEREKMLKYAVNDCVSVAELFIHMYPEKINNHEAQYEPVQPAPAKSTSSNIIQKNNVDLSDISDEELPEIFFPRFDKRTKPSSLSQANEQSNLPDQQPLHEHIQQSRPLSKSEQQKRRNEKYKWKKQHRPEFQLKIKRPIYYKYDYRKVRSQLRDDNIHTSHDITIKRKLNEVMIGFKSQQELERATNIIKINYFSKVQYTDRWGK